jgi:glycosyltransferase involved in cell wall biosynthesis
MKIAFANFSRRRVGGVEIYLGELIPELVGRGDEVGFLYEVDEPTDRELIPVPPSVVTWSVRELGAARAVDALRQWRPDVVFDHGLLDPSLEAEVLSVAPSVFFAHSYYGACISGLKTFRVPRVEPCRRRFGAACILMYFPRRCGGLSPVSMLREYGRQSLRLALLRRCDAIVTHSEHMRRQYVDLGLPPSRIHSFSYSIEVKSHLAESQRPSEAARSLSTADRDAVCRMLFLGRMDRLKGGRHLLRALDIVAGASPYSIRLTLAGDGPARQSWERAALRLTAKRPRLQVDFPGWVTGMQRDQMLEETDLLVVPSLWPEPFGRIGPEAGLRGIPAVAYDVGGISEWLRHGENGFLAPGHPPTPEGLAAVLLRYLSSPAIRRGLSIGAVRVASNFTIQSHLAALGTVFEKVIAERRAGAGPLEGP